MSGVARAGSRFNQFRNPGPCVAARIALTSNGEQRRKLSATRALDPEKREAVFRKDHAQTTT
jgi:hypothetical protein